MSEDLFDFSMKDVKNQLEIDRLKRDETKKDPRICKCGHPARSHTTESNNDFHRQLAAAGHFRCNPGRQQCPCKKFEAVMQTSDVRKFIFKTEGPAEQHALARGAMKIWEKGGQVDWIPGVSCDRCKTMGVKLTPIPLNGAGEIMTRPSAINVLLCLECKADFTKYAAF